MLFSRVLISCFVFPSQSASVCVTLPLVCIALPLTGHLVGQTLQLKSTLRRWILKRKQKELEAAASSSELSSISSPSVSHHSWWGKWGIGRTLLYSEHLSGSYFIVNRVHNWRCCETEGTGGQLTTAGCCFTVYAADFSCRV